MGLFSGSFGTGLITGLATSVDKSLKNAMDKRDEEMSSARKFWQQRQAQKLDQKEAYDKRAEKALRRMIQEAGDDVELGLAAFNAAGGDADSVETLIKRIDDTRANKGTYNLLDSLKDADGNSLKPGGVSVNLDDALKSVRQELSGVDANNISIVDPLANIGLGLKGGAAQAAADSVNALIPPETVERITGIPTATLDMSNMLEAEKYAQNQKLIAKQLTPTLAEANASIVQEIMGLDPTSATFADDSAKLIKKQNTILTAMGQEAQAKDTGGDGSLTASGLNTMYQSQLTAYLGAKGINSKEQSYVDEGGNVVYGDGKGYINAVAAHAKSFNTKFISTVRRDDGSFGPAASTLIGNNVNLQSIASGMSAADGATTDASLSTGDVPEVKFDSLDSINKNKAGYAADVFSRMNDINNKANTNVLFKTLIDSGASTDEANQIISDAFAQEQTIRKSQEEKYSGFVMPGSDLSADATATEVITDDDGTKTAGNVSWNPTYAPSMTKLLRDKDTPAGTKELVINDYVNMINNRGQQISKEDVKKKFGIN